MTLLVDVVADLQPRDPRRPATFDAAIRHAETRRSSARVLDLSTTGCKLETLDRLEPRVVIWITLPGLAPLAARVMWVRGYTAGCRFVMPLHPAVLNTVLPQ